jgi:hypothetical protein
MLGTIKTDLPLVKTVGIGVSLAIWKRLMMADCHNNERPKPSIALAVKN